MNIELEIISTNLLQDYIESVDFNIDSALDKIKSEKLPVDYLMNIFLLR